MYIQRNIFFYRALPYLPRGILYDVRHSLSYTFNFIYRTIIYKRVKNPGKAMSKENFLDDQLFPSLGQIVVTLFFFKMN